ncbi:methyltransferase domain-containing protein [Curvivirga aplysinae]|uniref:methyltransferase domain-containing protein n=1 Tax=Curvivirga aplysinae TaxID=2529852 RepID=UPI0012BC4126|nr:methyltransferase domain-containing protein [Curvivirga aplysinae]MTI10919.1 methyltransferase domain-containing protein [Curvivirga aplysinae]
MTDTSFTPSSDAVNIFDRNVVRMRRTRAAKITAEKEFGDANFLFMEVADRLVDRLLDVSRNFDLALDIGCHSGEVHHWLQNCPEKVKHLIQCDMAEAYAKTANARAASFVANEDLLPVKPESLDLVISNLSLHWVNDLPGAFAQIRQSLKPDGLFMGSMMGGESLFEMRSAIMEAEIELSGGISPRVSPFADIRDAGSLMQRAGFNLPVLDSEVIDVTYENLFKLAQDLRNMGETNAVHERVKSFSSRQLFMRAAEIYAEKHTNDEGRIPASFVIIYMHGWAPDPSQQQPAKPGSGQTSLADFLTDTQEG